MIELLGVAQETPTFAAGASDEADFDSPSDSDLFVAPEAPRLGPGPGHPEVMSWARAM